MTQTTKVIGTIDAMRTLTELFPMGLLDFKLHRYDGITYIFTVLITVLKACGVDINEIINQLIEKIYGIQENFKGGVETVYSQIRDLDVDTDSGFLNVLEQGIKGILMSLLTAIFTCSANPELQNIYLDSSIGEGLGPEDVERFKEYIRNYPQEQLTIPSQLIDFFGQLNIDPFSNEGRMYFPNEGGDIYYEKKSREEVIGLETTTKSTLKPKYAKYAKLYVDFGGGHDYYLNSTTDDVQDEIVFKITEPVYGHLKITVEYEDQNGNERTWVGTIKSGDKQTEVFFVTPMNKIRQSCKIMSVNVSGAYCNSHDDKYYEMDLGGGPSFGYGTYAYWDKEKSLPVLKYWKSQKNESLFSSIAWDFTANGYQTETYTVETNPGTVVTTYYYDPCDEVEDAVRVDEVPLSPSASSPDYIVCYDGLNPNTMYKTYDMNSFIWYVMSRSNTIPQVEKNKTMWDNRNVAKKRGVKRDSSEEWNRWLNSKTDEYGKLSFADNNEDEVIYPIVQLTRSGGNICVTFPSQRYFKPKRKTDDNTFVYENVRLNSTLYRFNWEYLQSIKILNPKVILYGMFDALLFGALSAFAGIKVTPQRKETETILANAIKKYIEAEDSEVEDCYFNFSNDEFDKMMQDMLLSKYNATFNGGEENVAVQHDIKEYFDSIDKVNFSATATGETTQIKKIVTDVSVAGGKEGTIDYGLSVDANGDWINNFLFALCLPIIKSLFTPQVVLLIVINFRLLGVMSFDDLLNNYQSQIITFITNKIFSLIKSIISYIKDKLVLLLYEMFLDYVMPLIERVTLLIGREEMEKWIKVLRDALECLPLLTFNRKRIISQIDEVDYADIIKGQERPESTNPC